jgi:type IV pilus assembly protein PilB
MMLKEKTLIQNRYELAEEILKCRFSTLFQARDLSTGAEFVMRMLHQGLPSDTGEKRKDALIQIRREGNLLSRLAHRNLPQVLDLIEEEDRVYLILEDFRGRTLENFMSEIGGPADDRILKRWLGQFLSVLGYLHSQDPPIVHRDLRPDSILLTPHGVIKLAEFGLARMQETASSGQTLFKAEGSPFYAAPEQLMKAPSEPGNDLYSLGALLYFLATRTSPRKSLERLRDAAGDAPVRDLNPLISPEMEKLISRLMEPDLRKRFSSAAEVQEAFIAACPQDLSGSLILPRMVRAAAPAGKAATEVPPLKKEGGWEEIFQKPWFEEGPRISATPTSKPSDGEMARFPFVDLKTLQIDRETGKILPESVSRSIEGVCIGRRGGSEITVAVKDPTQVHIYDHVSYGTRGQYKAAPVRGEGLMIDLAREFIYRVPASSGTWLEWLEMKKFESDRLDVKQKVEDLKIFGGKDEVKGPVIEAMDRIIKEAISIGASDIHLETYENEMALRYRMDGVLHLVESFDRAMSGAMVKRLKIMAGMDIAQDRITQGGRLSVRVKDREFDLRISVVPVPHGESVVMRLLNKGAFHYKLSDLGFQPEEEGVYQRLLSQPHGMILVSGPTGSGKSTTLYASLAEINRPDRKLLTVEDPIEYEMPGVTQVQVNTAPREDEKKVTFARALREFLRQDPDVILVGEIRDRETAAISVQAALTGHLLLSTIHTNDAVGIITRLEDMGVEPFLISSTLVGGLAQRLVRKICPDCREETEITQEARELLEKEGIGEARVFHGKGCLKCRNTGLKGRVALYEILEVTPEMRSLIANRASEDDLRKKACGQGMRTLYQDGLKKFARGLITLEEVKRVTMSA